MSKKPIRVLIVDDSGLVRELISTILGSDPEIVVVGEAADGKEAYEKVIELRPDIVTMDIEMPVLGGLEAIEKIMASYPVPILVITALTGVRTAFAAVSKGALDVIEKPDISIENVRKLITKVRLLGRVDINAQLKAMGKRPASSSNALKMPATRSKTTGKVVTIVSSTGGPQALYKIFGQLPAVFPYPILVTQHIAEGFTQGMVDWLSGGTALKVQVATHGQRLQPGNVYVNPAEHTMTLSGQTITLGSQDTRLLYHPSCDTMLKSVAKEYGDRTISLILSGMGNDGVDGMRAIKTAGGSTLAQDANSSVVYGMNKLAVDKGHIDTVLPLDQIAAGLIQLADCFDR